MLFRIFLSLWLVLPLAGAFAGSMTLLGVGSGAAAPFQGAGDIVSGATIWGSCSRVYDASHANTSTSMCDLVAVTGGAAVCTLRGSSSGFVDLAASYCAGTTPSLACAAANGGSCKVTKVYDQTGNGHPWIEATLANMPALVFNSINGLPAMQFVSANVDFMDTTSPPAISSPLTASGVFKRTGSFSTASFFMSDTGNAIGIGFGSSANTSMVAFPTVNTQSATDSAWHSIQGVGSTTVGALNTDGTDSGNINTGATGIPSNNARLGASGAGVAVDGLIAECGYWPLAMNATQRGNLSTNQHSATSGYNF